MSLDYDKIKAEDDTPQTSMSAYSDLFAALAFVFIFLYVISTIQLSLQTISSKLEAQKLELTTWDNLNAEVKKLKAEAEKATEDKNKAYKKLLAWWRDFSKVVDVALKENPQLKEQISKVTPTAV